MTPIGLYVYKRIMEKGFIFDIDHMEIGMKTQALMLAEAQDIPYPMVSTHGGFGGTTNDQAIRMYRNGGHIYPSLGGANSISNWVRDTKPIWEAAAGPHRVEVFGLGYGTDTNGLSGQHGARGSSQISANPLQYPFSLYENSNLFGALSDFIGGIDTVEFDQPCVVDPALAGGNVADCDDHVGSNPTHGRTWHMSNDSGGDAMTNGSGAAQYGMTADFIEELEIEASIGSARHAAAIEPLFLSAEAYLQTWQKTLAARDSILNNDNGGFAKEPEFDILRPAPRRIGGGGPSEDINDPDKNHYDIWGTEEDPYLPARPAAP